MNNKQFYIEIIYIINSNAGNYFVLGGVVWLSFLADHRLTWPDYASEVQF